MQVDFISGAVAHRRQYGGGKGQLIAKAVGIKPKIFPSVLDVTAGFGKDAFVLATLGCAVTLVERHQQVFTLLQEGIDRAKEYAQESDDSLLETLKRMTLLHRNSLNLLKEDLLKINDVNSQAKTYQVIYMDPMFPERKKTAAVKKEMVFLQGLVGDDADSDELLICALESGASRVVVKRPRLAPCLANLEPPLVFAGKSCRFDVYPLRKLL